MKLTWCLLGALVTVAAVASVYGRRAPTSTTAVASEACVIALAPSDERDENDRRIARAQERARAAGERKGALEQLGYHYIARARARSDAGDYTLAEKTAECLAFTYPDDASGFLLRGHAMHQLHRFVEAEHLARQLVAKRGIALDYGLLGDVLMEQGRLREAAVVYQKMIDLKPFYQSYTRAAHLRWLKGEVEAAIELMRMAVGAASPRDPESAAWAYTRLAAYELQSGRLKEAATAVDAALEHQRDYAAALLTRGRILLAMQQPTLGLEALRRAAQLNPLPEYQWALADALRLSGLAGEADAIERTLTTNGRDSDPRTLALFLATRRASAAEAVALAQSELRTRSDVFTLDAVAWALAAAGRIGEAEPLMKRAVAEGTQDGRLFLHAAAISAAAGRHADARRWAEKTERLRAMLLPSELNELEAIHSKLPPTQEN